MKKIGITLPAKKLLNFWTNGLGQNAITLYRLLEKQGYDVWFLTDRNEKLKTSKNLKGIKWKVVWDSVKSGERFDLLLEIGFSFQGGNEKYRQQLTDNMVAIKYGNEIMWDLESMTKQGCTREIIPTSDEPIQEIWISPHFQFGDQYIKTKHKASSVKVCPYIWSTEFIEGAIKKSSKDPRYSPDNKKAIGVFEPNLQIVKSCLIPVMICEEAHNQNIAFDSAWIFGTDHIRKSKQVIDLFKNLKISRAGKISFEDRRSLCYCLSNYVDIIISHHHFNSLNYLTLEALYLGYPIIHNSKDFKDAGYYYEDFDIQGAVNALRDVIENHDNNLEEYKKKGEKYIWKYSPENPENIKGYIDLIEGTFK